MGEQQRFNAAAHWVLGYLTAAAGYSEDTFDLTPWQTPDIIMGQMVQFCDKNPDMPLVQATAAYVLYLQPQKLSEPAKLVELRQGSNAIKIYAPLVGQIQTKLFERGLLTDVPSGEFDQRTADAIRKVQAEAKIDETGLPDGRTMLLLFREAD